MRKQFLVLLFCLILISSTAFAANEVQIIKPERGDIFKKGENIDVVVEVDLERLDVISAKAWLSGSPEKTIDLNMNSDGDYEGTYVLAFDDKVTGSIEVEIIAEDRFGAEYSGKYAQLITVIPLNINYSFELSPSGPYYFGSVIEKVYVNAKYENGEKVTPSDLVTEMRLSGSRESIIFEEDPETGLAVADIDFPIELEGDLLSRQDNVIEIGFYALNDRFDNKGTWDSKEISIQENNPALRLNVRNLDPYASVFEGTDLEFDIVATEFEEVSEVKVYLLDEETQRMECSESSVSEATHYFSCMQKMPTLQEKSVASYFVLAEAIQNGKKVISFKRFEFQVGRKVYVRLNYPIEKEVTTIEANEIRLGLWIGNDLPLGKDTVAARINGKDVTLRYDPATKEYVAEYDLASIGYGDQTIRVELIGDYDVDKEYFDVALQEPTIFSFFATPFGSRILFVVIILAIAVPVAISSFMVWRRKNREKIESEKKSAAELAEKIAETKKQIKHVRFDYMAGGMTESAFHVKVTNLRRQLKQLQEKQAAQVKPKEKQASQ
ncbi:MAG: hypothetical protein JW772_05005 [Candidatus Diapherotrites archaeon]|nr:hypothetical protein [Candidatus Diapherotrites archaeon]